MKFTIYKISNSVTGKSYVGYTKLSPNERWSQHAKRAFKLNEDTKFYNSIRKHGTEVWTVETIETTDTAQCAKEREVYHINDLDTYYSGYNSTKGGDGNNGIVMSEKSNKARSDKLKGVPKNYDRMKGKTHRAESKILIARAHKGMKKPWVKWSPEQITQRAMTRRSLTKEQHGTIISMKSEGHSLKFISDKTGIKYDIVKKWSKREWDLNL